MAWIQTMVPTVSSKKLQSNGEKAYRQYCMTCHGEERKGNTLSGYPNLVDIIKRKNKTFLKQIIAQGKGMMPGFSHLSKEEQANILNFISDEVPKEVLSNELVKGPQIPYRMTGYNKFLDNKGLPAISPPWGTLNAIDLNTGKYVWKIPFGEEPLLAEKGIYDTGVENYGGPVITSNGLIFIAATKDGYFRVFDTDNGSLLWKTKLPAAGFATPSTYMVNGKQYVVIACGGTKLGTPKGNKYVAFALKN
jgi:quinoprotein glucose dehydrogenase